jgi:hypothetical protein
VVPGVVAVASDSVERFRGPDYLTRFKPDPDAMGRLLQIESCTAQRLIKYVRGGWPGMLSAEDFLGPLTAAEGDILYRAVDSPGSHWIWWRGSPCGKHYYGRVSALPHYHDHKVVGRRKASADKLAEYLTAPGECGTVIPVHVKNAPDPIWRMIQNDRPYRDRDLSSSGDQNE